MGYPTNHKRHFAGVLPDTIRAGVRAVVLLDNR